MGGVSTPAEAGAHDCSRIRKEPINRLCLQLAIAFAKGSIRCEPGGESALIFFGIPISQSSIIVQKDFPPLVGPLPWAAPQARTREQRFGKCGKKASPVVGVLWVET